MMLRMSVQASVPGAVRRAGVAAALVIAGAIGGAAGASAQDVAPVDGRIAAGGVLRVSVPEAFGAKTVIGQLTVDRTVGAGFVTAYGCADGLPVDAAGNPSRSDLNYDSSVGPVASNRLVVQADEAGDICFYTLQPAALIVDVNATTFDTGITSFPNRRTDTRDTPAVRLAAGGVLRVGVPEAVGGKTVVGQLTVDRAQGAGFVTAYGCDEGLPVDAAGAVTKSDLNYDSTVSPVASNRLIVQADADGAVCFYTLRPAALVVDVNGVSDGGIASFRNQRTDTRTSAAPQVAGGGLLRVNVPEAVGAKTVVGQLSVDRIEGAGFVTAYGCDDGIPTDAAGAVSRSDLNYDSAISAVASNRLIVQADADGDVCFFTLRPAALVVDVNAVSAVGISSFPNQRTDTRTGGAAPGGTGSGDGVPTWPPYEPLPAVAGVAALTGFAADSSVTSRPVVAVKIDNYWRARPQWGLDEADVVIEENVEGVTRFVALFHSRTPAVLGPVRSARTGDLDLLAAMNRPVFAYSGANAGRDRLDRLGHRLGAPRRLHRPAETVLLPHTRSPRAAQPAARSDVCAARRRGGLPRAGPTVVADRCGLGAARRRRRHARHHVPGADGRRRRHVGLGGRDRRLPQVAGRPAARRGVGRPAHREQRRRAVGGARAVARGREVAEPDHRRDGQRRRAPRRCCDRCGVVTGHALRRVRVLRRRNRGAAAARHGCDVRRAHPGVTAAFRGVDARQVDRLGNVRAGHTPSMTIKHADDDRAPAAAPQANGTAGIRGLLSSGTDEVELTDRELTVLDGVARGMTNREIADELFLSVDTVKTHARRLYAKLGVSNRIQAAMRGRWRSDLPSALAAGAAPD